MSLNMELLKILACPRCGGDLELLPDEKGLLCEKCKLVFPIIDEIPVLLIEDALPWNEGKEAGPDFEEN